MAQITVRYSRVLRITSTGFELTQRCLKGSQASPLHFVPLLRKLNLKEGTLMRLLSSVYSTKHPKLLLQYLCC